MEIPDVSVGDAQLLLTAPREQIDQDLLLLVIVEAVKRLEPPYLVGSQAAR